MTTLTTEEEPKIRFDYLGETVPTDRVIRFDPAGYVSNSVWFWHGAPVFSPNGDELYWAKYLVGVDLIEIWVAKKIDGIWTEGRKLEIEGIEGATNSPVFLDNPNELYFLNVNLEGKFMIYQATRIDGVWTNPVALDIEIPTYTSFGWGFSMAANKNIYFNLNNSKIYVSKFQDGEYSSPIAINAINLVPYSNISPTIAFDDSYLLFASNRPGGYGLHDIYISFKDEMGEFMDPINLGSQINSSNEEAQMTISRDGLYFFFSTHKSIDSLYNPYWIVLEELSVFKNR